ncbi:MAG: glutamine-hydrolyzing carbamoyl-phosphate synthase small subunit [Lachnospiraceae bacterium]|jgi:carbamoyl-phosphate synthase small subunit
MIKKKDRKIVLEDGTEIFGYGFGSTREKYLELVFNTSVVGYQELVSDPSYAGQAVVMTYPLIGNYGMADDDYETEIPSIGALVVRQYNDVPSNFRSVASLGEVMKKYDIAGISGVDTRALARYIRNFGSCKAMITAAGTSVEYCIERMKTDELPRDYVARVSRRSPEVFRAETEKYHVAAYDCGIKQNIIRSLNLKGCTVTVLPWNTPASEVEKLNPDGIFLSNGPGDPEDVGCLIDNVRKLKGKFPMFGICLGHQIISLAFGAKTYKLKFGHRGGNHPVKNILTDKIEITSQNHSYAVDKKSLEGTGLKISHFNILDNTIEGVYSDELRTFGVQYHPESAPGPQDSGYLFDDFTLLMDGNNLSDILGREVK